MIIKKCKKCRQEKKIVFMNLCENCYKKELERIRKKDLVV